jgi:hypothetical protein
MAAYGMVRVPSIQQCLRPIRQPTCDISTATTEVHTTWYIGKTYGVSPVLVYTRTHPYPTLVTVPECQERYEFTVLIHTAEAPPVAPPPTNDVDHDPLHWKWKSREVAPVLILEVNIVIEPQDWQEIDGACAVHGVLLGRLSDGAQIDRRIFFQRCDARRLISEMRMERFSKTIHDSQGAITIKPGRRISRRSAFF